MTDPKPPLTLLRRKVVLGLGLAFVLLGLIGGWVLLTSPPSQPVYQGRPLMDWAAQLASPDARERHAASEAIRAVGPAGLPTFRRALMHGDSVLGRAVEASEARLPQKVWHHLYARTKPFRATQERVAGALAIELLGPAARDALPELAAGLRDRKPQVVRATINALVAIGPDSTEVLAAHLESPSLPRGALQFHESVRIANQLQMLTGLGRIGSAKVAVPAMAALLRTSTNVVVVEAIGSALRKIGPEALPAVLEVMTSPDAPVRARARTALHVMVNDDLDLLIALTEAFPRQPTRARLGILLILQEVSTYRRRATLAVAMALEDPAPEIRETAAAWLRETQQLDALERLLTNQPEGLKRRVRDVFVVNTNSPALPASAVKPAPLP